MSETEGFPFGRPAVEPCPRCGKELYDHTTISRDDTTPRCHWCQAALGEKVEWPGELGR